MAEEILDIFTRDGRHIGTKTREECHQNNPGYYHKPVWIWVINNSGEILVQKRSAKKKSFQGYWDIPSAGHVDAGESIIKGAIRETKEELGLDTDAEDYQFVGEYISDTTWELGQVYILKIDKKAEDMSLQEEEVEEVKWLSFDRFKELLYSDLFIPYDDEFKKMSIETLKKYIGL